MAANFETYSVNNQPLLAFVFVSQMWLSDQKAIMRFGFILLSNKRNRLSCDVFGSCTTTLAKLLL